jgi:hypothetical protein
MPTSNLLTQQQEILPRLDVVHPLNPADEASCFVDIVAVHGIHEKDFDQAWTLTRGSMTCVSWLTDADMLPAAIPHLRVLSFRYDPNTSREGLRVHLERTSARLRELIQQRVLWIGHRPVSELGHLI